MSSRCLAAGVGAVWLMAACGGIETTVDQETTTDNSALLTTEFADAVAVSQQGLEDQIVSELRTLDGKVVAQALMPADGGEGTISFDGAEPTAFIVASPPSLQEVHNVLYRGWTRMTEAALGETEEVEYGGRCSLGSDPTIKVNCDQTYCRFPDPYQAYGGVLPSLHISKSSCEARAASCDVPASRVYWYDDCVQVFNGEYCYAYCMWETFCPLTRPGLTSPSGDFVTDKPTYQWKADKGSTHYYLQVKDDAGTYRVKKWYPAKDICKAGTCQATPAVTLNLGNHSWRVQPWSKACKYGPWSAWKTFRVQCKWATPEVIAPLGTIASTKPTYKWVFSPNGTWYELWVNGPSGKVFSKWYRYQDICGGASTCSVKPDIALQPGKHTWWIRPWNDNCKHGPWSGGNVFTVQ